MLEPIRSEKLDGNTLTIWRLKTDTPTEQQPAARFLRFIQGTTGLENPQAGRKALSYWRIYFHAAFTGRNWPEIVDYFYFAEVDGQIAARLWFAYAPANNFGNFGNILTVPEFRRRGILRRLLSAFQEDVSRTPAECLACSASSMFAAKTYMDYGFRLIDPGEAGPMALVSKKHGSFQELAAKLFADPVPARVRPGVLGDQFRIDKFLAYCKAFHDEPPRSQLMDYRCCMQEVLGGNGRIAVAENAGGTPLGFAWAGQADGMMRLTFLIHPDAAETAGKALLAFFRQGAAPLPVFILESGDRRSLRTLQAAKAQCLCTLADGASIWQLNPSILLQDNKDG